MDPLHATDIALRMGAALLLGSLVGLERERKHRPAGFRTMILISIGSAAFLIAGREMVAQIDHATPPGQVPLGQAELSRVLQGLIGGIGFLGAGAVIQNKRAVRGITTAAAVWVTSAIGAACGLGLYVLGAILAATTLFTLVVLGWLEDHWFPEPDEEFRKNGDKNGEKNGKDRRDDNDAGEGPARMRGEG